MAGHSRSRRQPGAPRRLASPGSTHHNGGSDHGYPGHAVPHRACARRARRSRRRTHPRRSTGCLAAGHHRVRLDDGGRRQVQGPRQAVRGVDRHHGRRGGRPLGRAQREAHDRRRVGQRPGRDPDRPVAAADVQRGRRAGGPGSVPRRPSGARQRQLPRRGLVGQPHERGHGHERALDRGHPHPVHRSDILAEVGLSGPPTTWAEFTAAAEKLAARGGSDYGYYIPQWDAPLPIEFTWQTGGDVIGPDGAITLDTPEFRKAVDFYLSFFEKKLVPTASDFDQTAGFISGAAPMLISGPYLAAAIKDQAPELEGKWAITTLPKDVTGTSLFAGSNLGVWKGSDNIPGALALLDFLAAPATQVAWFQAANLLPTNLTAAADSAVTADPNVAVYAAQLQDAKTLPLIPEWDKVGGMILTSLNKIALEGADKEATLQALFADVAAMQ